MSFEDFFWGPDQGYFYRTFDKLKVDLKTIQNTRVLGILVIIFWLIIGLYYSGDGSLHYCYLTTWGGYFTLISLILNYIAAWDQRSNPGPVSGPMFYVWRTSVWFFELTLVFNVIITIIYWAFLTDDYSGDDPLRYWYGVFIHTMPLLFTMTDYLMQKWKFRSAHFLPMTITGVLYMFVNYEATIESGKPLYPIIVWDPIWESLLACLLVLGFMALVFAILKHLTNSITGTSIYKYQNNDSIVYISTKPVIYKSITPNLQDKMVLVPVDLMV